MNCSNKRVIWFVDMPQEVSIIVALCALAVVYAGTIPSGSLQKLAPRRTTNLQNLPARGHQLPEVRKRYLHTAISEYLQFNQMLLDVYRLQRVVDICVRIVYAHYLQRS